MTKLLPAALFAACSLFALPSFAGDDMPAPDHPNRAEFCKNNPTTCEVGDERRAAKKEWCEKNADKCQALKDEHKARVQKMKEKCDADPAACEAKKAEMREKFKERRERRKEAAQQPAQ